MTEDRNSDNKESRFEDIFSYITKIASGLTIVFAVGSLIYEYMYFWTIGRDILLFFSASDFLKLTIQWLPTLLITILMGLWLSRSEINGRIIAYRSRNERAIKDFEKADRVSDRLFKLMIVMSILAIPFATWEKIGIVRNLLYISMGTFIANQISGGRLPKTNRPVEAILFYGVVAMIWTTALIDGLEAGVKDLKRNEPVYHLSTADGKNDVVVIRAIDKGIVYRSHGRSFIEFAPWGQIKHIQSNDISVSDESIFKWLKKKYF